MLLALCMAGALISDKMPQLCG